MLLPVGVRHRQLAVRTLILGMLLTLDGRRPAFLTEVHAALIALPAADQARLGVSADWKTGPHLLTYRQVEHTFRLITRALGKDTARTARPRPRLHRHSATSLLEASIPAELKDATAGAGRRLDRRGDLVPAAPPRQHRVRRPRGVLGAPQLQPARPQRRDVLRVLPVGSPP